MGKVKMVNMTKLIWKTRFCESWVLVLIIWNLVLSSCVIGLVRDDFVKAANSEPPAIEEITFEPIKYEN
jgi:hypothetical protein